MKLVVGLGNPGKEYENTRHNVGFLIIDNYANTAKLSFKEKFNGMYFEAKINDEKVIFLKPLSYMNLSGIVVKKYLDYFKIKAEDLFIIYDDMDFEIGTFKIKPSGSSAGHNGIKNIIENVGTENIKRMRVGISKSVNNKIDYVIGNFTKKEKEKIDKIIDNSNIIIDDFVKLSFEELMNKYNKEKR